MIADQGGTPMIRGTAHVFGDDVNTDEIIPARYLNRIDADFLGAHCMEDADPEFLKRMQAGDVIVAGENFGCGSSREHAPLAIKGAGVACVVARSFARIFFRNAINIGLPIVACPEAAADASAGDDVEIDPEAGRLVNHTTGRTFAFPPFTEEIQAIIAAGGLMPFVKQRLAER